MSRKSAKQTISDYMAKLGQKGGSKKGPSKARDPEKMHEAAKKRWRREKGVDKDAGENRVED
jgi:general stress protein YciG